MKEAATRFGSGGLVGVISEPSLLDRRPGAPAFLLLNAGVTHRVGPNRVHVHLARALASKGFLTMRFDYSGIGDSAPRRDELTTRESVVLETQEAMDLLATTKGAERFVLVGICSGATSSLMVARVDRRIAGAILINGHGHLLGADIAHNAQLRTATLARHARRIALSSSFRAKNWRKALFMQIHPLRTLRMLTEGPLRAIFSRRSGRPVSGTHPAVEDLRALAGRGTYLFHLYCEGDEGLDYFHVVLRDKLAAVTTGDRTRFEVIRGANHVFTMRWSQEHLVRVVCDWAKALPVT